MFSVLLAGCGIREMLPQSPVLTGWERSRGWASEEPSTATYTGEPVVTFPVLPVQVWGAAYDLDLVIVTRHPDWNMHEYAMLRTPRGPVWLAKDAREGTMEQTIVADIDDIQSWIPEIPVRRKAWPLEVEDASTAEWLDLSIRYENIDGEPVEVTYAGKPPDLLQRKRNGSTFGHSRDAVLAAVDVSERRFGRRASVTIDGKKQRISRLAGLVPFRMVLAQAQGGLAVADIFQEAGAPWEVEPDAREVVGSVPPEAADAGMARIDSRAQPAFTTTHTVLSGDRIRRTWEVSRTDRYLDAYQRDDLRVLHYRFGVHGDAWELLSADVWQWGRANPVMHLQLEPALPDLRCPFEGRHVSRYVIDINGQENLAVGTLEAWWEEDGPRVALQPEAPWWTADRPMTTAVRLEEGGAHVVIERTSR
ncbi:MAG: hypothetical protein JRJ84_13800 [Deltaproteobacteria bacterium]|nr:hypothetical protein [Deltaproteobacteria bacterium]